MIVLNNIAETHFQTLALYMLCSNVNQIHQTSSCTALLILMRILQNTPFHFLCFIFYHWHILSILINHILIHTRIHRNGFISSGTKFDANIRWKWSCIICDWGGGDHYSHFCSLLFSMTTSYAPKYKMSSQEKHMDVNADANKQQQVQLAFQTW